ncbi:MAG: DUF1127 domain-containing protein [Shimia sp.]|nr:DUF1127 domain-containing protein [Shimia sp.]MCP4822808.1 DUF1127 domain-containing protein [Shimia sp.]|eukprot:CAMPEP_0184419930 /NCGR_PEP_ID=MMETSP0738-20130409/45447_1 /TAXON_ID=385413 /ORGANISM="Thalassiosira miniscula, Strain CCMP1093" /LENGTH=71 /DNA_ID=CAMNT_0026780639 /DNA_START=86 /DNA_END=304 /DNA_ORIENTATION=+
MQHAPSLHIEAVDIVGRFTRLVENWLLTRKRDASFAKTVKELNKLTNRELADIGLSRGDIEDVARKGALAL